ncbi:MTH1187 family thiamine-binding protein [Neobacillus drentensis]|uniref:MTH1187 family thiamine-binding protein n=1 Tax=Neobacillus drentensis TaxID=220684 RepID=UPI0030003CA9
MAIVDVTVIPVGTETPSVSKYVASVQRVLRNYEAEGKIKFQLTPMNTIIEGELPVLFEVIQAMHEIPFSEGIKRVATSIRIDDRRDVKRSMDYKVERVNSLLSGKEDR